ADLIEEGIGRDQVLLAVAVEVPHCHGSRPSPGAVVDGALEGAGAGAQKNGDVAGAVIYDGQVLLAVAVEVPHRHSLRHVSDGVVDGVLKSAIAVAQQSSGVVAVIVGSGQVGFAVAVEVPHRHGNGPGCGEVSRGGEVDGAEQGPVFERL